MRNIYLNLAQPYIPRLLHLIDQNPYSPTYGCFDRAFWHYRTMDFPCGMSQEMVLPLSLAFAREYPANKYYQTERLKELSEAAIRYMIKSSHKDGTCDDYFPYERAMGALVFSLYAATEAYQVIGMQDDEIENFFLKRVHHLENENETGRLSNHQALAGLAAYNVFCITGDDKARKTAEDRVALTLSWQDPDEGWYQEYEGADPGYHTCTIDFLAKYLQKRSVRGEQTEHTVLQSLIKAVDFSWYFMHPDGSYGGEYGSRNTYHFYPHGFELMAPHTEKAGQIADAFLQSADLDKRYHNDDDRMTAHYVYNFMQAWEDYHPKRPNPIIEAKACTNGKWMPSAKIFVNWNTSESGDIQNYLITNQSKGGVLKIFDSRGCIASDTGLIGELTDGTIVVSHLIQQDSKFTENFDKTLSTLEVQGDFCIRKANGMTVFKQLLLRLWLVTIGRFNANLTRSIVQKIAITGKPKTSYRFKRVISVNSKEVKVTDFISNNMPLKRLSIGSDATSIYVANSLVFQESRLSPWQHANLSSLPTENGQRVWQRSYFRGSRHSPEIFN